MNRQKEFNGVKHSDIESNRDNQDCQNFEDQNRVKQGQTQTKSNRGKQIQADAIGEKYNLAHKWCKYVSNM